MSAFGTSPSKSGSGFRPSLHTDTHRDKQEGHAQLAWSFRGSRDRPSHPSVALRGLWAARESRLHTDRLRTARPVHSSHQVTVMGSQALERVAHVLGPHGRVQI